MASRPNRRLSEGQKFGKNAKDAYLNSPVMKLSSQKPKKVTDDGVINCFQAFQKLIDCRNDKRERLVKCSRDITIESKRIIFLLHRVSGVCEKVDDILTEASSRLKNVVADKFRCIASELQGEDHFQFMFAIRPGIQEFIEALTFSNCLQKDQLMSYEDVKNFVNNVEYMAQDENSAVSLTITPEDYLMGIADLSGELMRLAINYISAGNFYKPQQVMNFLRRLQVGFLSVSRTCGGSGRELRTKTTVLNSSLAKVEHACYVLKLRGSEVPEHMLADVVACFFQEQQHQRLDEPPVDTYNDD